MPAYDFICDACGNEREISLPVEERDTPQKCERCRFILRRKIALPQSSIIKMSGNDIALAALNSGISCPPEKRAEFEAGALAGLEPKRKKVIGKGAAFKK